MAQKGPGEILAKGLGIDTAPRHARKIPNIPAHDSAITSTDGYVEEDPTVQEWLWSIAPTKAGVVHYFQSLFPFYTWIFHYNLQWFFGDLIAGVTVGMVVIPQGMAYALLAKLNAEYGLYTSFVGFLLYWAFATSKDITIGAVAVMSTLVGNIVIKVQKQHKEIPAEQIARGLSVICGSVLLFIGLTRLGWIVEFIPLIAISAFMTGAAISIGVGQVPAMMGITGINTREATHKVIINTLKALPRTKIDAAMGLSALVLLYSIRFFCEFMGRKQANRRKFWFFVSTLRMAFVILLYTLISFLVNRHIKGNASKAKFKILGTVPRGFQHVGAPHIDVKLLKALASELPASIIVLLIEHIAISKSFGRVNNYTINPSQELVAIGFTNILGPFLGGYPATGSFSRTAIKSKAGVRTPLAGIYTAVVVLLALYALTSVFFYIPMASLSGLIIHAVGDLITPPGVVYQYWEVSPMEVVIFFAGVFVTIFTNIENGIYVSVAISAALLLFRVAKADGAFLGRVRTYTVDLNHQLEHGKRASSSTQEKEKDFYVPINHRDGLNPAVGVQAPYPGVVVYRFSEGYSYINQARYLDDLTTTIFKLTRRTKLDNFERLGDRPWNNPGPRRGKQAPVEDHRPILHAVVLDWSSVDNTDVTSIQGLCDVRKQLDGYAAPGKVEWHMANVKNRWTKRALVAAGFGFDASALGQETRTWKSIISTAEVTDGAGSIEATKELEVGVVKGAADDIEGRPAGIADDIYAAEKKGAIDAKGEANVTRIPSTQQGALYGLNRPFFHPDVETAVKNAVANVERKTSQEKGVDEKY